MGHLTTRDFAGVVYGKRGEMGGEASGAAFYVEAGCEGLGDDGGEGGEAFGSSVREGAAGGFGV